VAIGQYGSRFRFLGLTEYRVAARLTRAGRRPPPGSSPDRLNGASALRLGRWLRGGGLEGCRHWRGGGWGLGAAGLAIGTGIALAATAPYAYGGYYPYGGYYDDYYAYPSYTYGYGHPYGVRLVYPAYIRASFGGYPGFLSR